MRWILREFPYEKIVPLENDVGSHPASGTCLAMHPHAFSVTLCEKLQIPFKVLRPYSTVTEAYFQCIRVAQSARLV